MTKRPHYLPGEHALWRDMVALTTPFGQATRGYMSSGSDWVSVRSWELKVANDFYNGVVKTRFLDVCQARWNKQAMLVGPA